MHFRISLLSLGLAATAWAQTIPPSGETDDLHLDEFEVTSHPYARPQSEIAQPTTVLGGEALDQRQAMTLGDMLSSEPGVSSSYFGPGAGRPIIRGMSGARVAVLQNGSDLIDAASVSPDHAVSIDPLLIERVEITRGPAALLHGGSAIGGAVNVVTHRIHTDLPSDGVHGRIEGRLGDVDNERSGGAVFEGAAGPIAWHVDMFTRETDDIDIPGFAESKYQRRQEALEAEEDHDDEHEDDHDEDHDDDHEDHDEDEHDDDEEAFGTVPNSYVQNDGGAIGLSWIGERGYLGLSFSQFDSAYGIPPGAHNHAHEHEDEHEHDHEDEYISIDLQQRRLELAGELRDPFAGWRALRWQGAWADYEHTEQEGDAVGTVFTNTGFDFRLDALHEPWGAWQGTLALAWSQSDFEAIGVEAFVPPTDTRTLSLILFEERETGPNIFQVSARADRQSIDVVDGSGRDADNLGWASSFGIVHTLSPTWSIATSVSLTNRAPTPTELFADGPHIGTNAYEIGNPDLDDERALGIDVSLHRKGELLSGVLTAFAHEFDGFIYENPTGAEEDELPVYEFSQRDARFYGLEASGMLHLVETENSHLDLTFGLDMVHARNLTDATYLPRIPPLRWRTGADWSFRAIRLGTEIVFAEGQNDLAPAELPTDAYELWSAYASYRFIQGGTTWDLLLRGTNLTDSEARLHTSFLKDIAPLPGRNVSLSVRMSF